MPFFHPATPVGKISGSRKLVAKQILAIESGVPQLQILSEHMFRLRAMAIHGTLCHYAKLTICALVHSGLLAHLFLSTEPIP